MRDAVTSSGMNGKLQPNKMLANDHLLLISHLFIHYFEWFLNGIIYLANNWNIIKISLN